MSGDHPRQPTLGISSRRSACDRCRGQKLGCHRDRANPDGRCNRCMRADTQCITSPRYHIRPWVPGQDDAAANTTPFSSRRRRQHDQTRARELAPAQIQPSGGRDETLRPPSAASLSPTSFNWQVAVDPLAPGSGSGSTGSRPESETEPRRPTSNGGAGSTSYAAVGLVSTPTPVNPWNSGPMTLDHLLSTENAHNSFTSFNRSDSKVSRPQGDSGTGSSTEGNDQPTASWSPVPQGGLGASSLGVLGSLDMNINQNNAINHTEELSKINLELATQLKRMTKGPPYVNLKILIAPECGQGDAAGTVTTPLEDILNTTRRYLDCLALMAGSPHFLGLSPFSGLAPRVPNPYATVSPNTATPSSSEDNTSRFSEDASVASTPPSSVGGPTNKADSSTLLLLLICYVHILRLHVALFWHIQSYLQVLSESGDPTINPLPGLCGFDNLPLQSGNLQAVMIIQLVNNMFERIETLLGLPREFRIGTREPTYDGLFKTEGFLDIVTTILRKEEPGQPEEGKGGIKSLQRDMKKAQQLLRERIAP